MLFCFSSGGVGVFNAVKKGYVLTKKCLFVATKGGILRKSIHAPCWGNSTAKEAVLLVAPCFATKTKNVGCFVFPLYFFLAVL